MSERPLWFWCLLSMVAMSLGWALRGSIGGGSLGAMIPGAMIGLVLCLMLRREYDAGLIAALAAIGVGFGGQETYGQTVGLSRNPDTFWWAILGFAVKGAVWGLLGGAFIGIGLTRNRFTARRLILGFALMAIGTWIGWKFIDDPKYIYFSNRLDRPRPEVWAGLWLGGLFPLAWLRARVPSIFALHGMIGGGIGFAFGASLQPWGTHVWPGMPLGWWKAMEFTFGAILGLSYALCAWRLRNELVEPELQPPALSTPLLRAIAAAALVAVLAIYASERLPVRFGFTIIGAAIAALAIMSNAISWQTAITTTYAAFCCDLLDRNLLPLPAMWTLIVITSLIVAAVVARYPRPRAMLLLLTWTAVAIAALRYLIPPSRLESQVMIVVFVLCATLITIAIRQPSLETRRL